MEVDSVAEELEELLISADLGVKASTGIINGFAQRRLDKDISLPEIKEELAADIETILTPCQQPLIISPQNKPFVIILFLQRSEISERKNQ
mgnify:CR=1 FL=1